MPTIRYTRSAATASWIDARTGLPEVDRVAPAATVPRSFLTGNAGFRFANFMEVWASFDTTRGTVTGHGFTPASGLYRAPSFLDVPSQVMASTRTARVEGNSVVFIQIVGARTQSPEIIGGAIAGPLGNIVASMLTAFPPIWSEISIRLHPDGSTDTEVLRHSLFPSMTFYTRPVLASMTAEEIGIYQRTPVGPGGEVYNGMPNYDRWYRHGWGALGAGSRGPVTGNPIGMVRTEFTGIDPTQPYGW